MTAPAAPEFTAGQDAIWTGTQHLFEHRVTIVRKRVDWLMIFGETPEDGKTVYDIRDHVTKAVILGVAPEQLQAVA